MATVKVLEEVLVPGGGRLGRHVEHDDRSLLYLAQVAPALKSVQHLRRCAPFDQGDLGSCTGNMAAGLLMTEPFYTPIHTFTETDAVSIYSQATHVDSVSGVYPPDDTGSTGLAVMKVLKARNLIAAYRHAFGLEHTLGALVLGPVGFGVPWYEGFDNPTSQGECRIAGNVRGGHEIVADGIDMERRRVWLTQSWGATWGGLGNGKFFWSFDTVEKLLSEQGDVVTADVVVTP